MPRLQERAVYDPGRFWCRSNGSWGAHTSEHLDETYLVGAAFPVAGPYGPRSRVVRARDWGSPEDFPGITCPPGDEPEERSFSAFYLGDLGDSPSEPLTLCVDEPGCVLRYQVDPARHTLADRAHLSFVPGELRARTLAGGSLGFRIYTDRPMPDLLPLVVYHFRGVWYAEFTRPVRDREWEFPFGLGSFYTPEYRSSYAPEDPIRVYLLTMG